MALLLIPIAFVLLAVNAIAADPPTTLLPELQHLRADGPREWDEFPETADGQRLQIPFDSAANETEWTLSLRQQDVKQEWSVRVNDTEIGKLHRDENDMLVCFAVSAETLRTGKNELVVAAPGNGHSTPDDIRVGEITLTPRLVRDVLSAGTINVTVLDADSGEPSPARITIVNESGALQSVAAPADPQLAVRPGIVFTATGKAKIGVPAGTYTIYAGRGFEYSLATIAVTVRAGETLPKTLTIRREVPTDGYVACDTHVHTLTHSGHGDATVQERMVTIAAEGIELPIATDHNVQINHDPFAREIGVRQFFTPMIGNEVTTPVGHFNIFPVPAEAGVPDHRLKDWGAIFAEIDRATSAPVIVLNHARDLHSGVRPFGPKRFNSAVAESLDGWPAGFNAMEVINSGATQTDMMQLFHDWMELLNRGVPVTPIGASDSHDVGRHFIGQGRTYIRCEDSDPGRIDVAQAIESLRRGRVMVSYGLLAELTVQGVGSGDVVAVEGDVVRVDAKVLGPHWVDAERVELFANGRKIRETEIPRKSRESFDSIISERTPVGVKWEGHWLIPRPQHDVCLVAIARGPGIDAPYWKTAKPYQPTSPAWQAQVIGCSGAVWLDVDGDGSRTAAREYASRLWDASEGDLSRLLASLSAYDSAVAAHAGDFFYKAGGALTDAKTREALREAAPAVRDGFLEYQAAWRASETARANGVE